jgi:hypothetical protein
VTIVLICCLRRVQAQISEHQSARRTSKPVVVPAQVFLRNIKEVQGLHHSHQKEKKKTSHSALEAFTSLENSLSVFIRHLEEVRL